MRPAVDHRILDADGHAIEYLTNPDFFADTVIAGAARARLG